MVSSRKHKMQDNSHAFCNECVSQFILSDCLHRRHTCGYPSHGNCATTNWCDKFQTEGDHVYSCRFCFIKIVDCVKINTRRQTSHPHQFRVFQASVLHPHHHLVRFSTHLALLLKCIKVEMLIWIQNQSKNKSSG